MCPIIRRLTLVMTALPPALVVGAIFGLRPLWIPAALLTLTYGWVWTRFRPTAFAIHADAVEVIWPLKRREIRRDRISAVRVIDRHELQRQAGWGIRVGAGGLWGGFGWFWSSRRGIVQMYVSRLDRFVWIERGNERPWLITPDEPEAFVAALIS